MHTVLANPSHLPLMRAPQLPKVIKGIKDKMLTYYLYPPTQDEDNRYRRNHGLGSAV
jgi:hypothetical protein